MLSRIEAELRKTFLSSDLIVCLYEAELSKPFCRADLIVCCHERRGISAISCFAEHLCVNGVQYVGEFQDNTMHGTGAFTCGPEVVEGGKLPAYNYEGDIVNGAQEGNGVLHVSVVHVLVEDSQRRGEGEHAACK